MSGELRYLVVTFPTTHEVLSGERRLRGLGVDCEFIPVPVPIDASCGFCLRLPVPRGEGEGDALLSRAMGIEHEALWRVIEGASWKERMYERIDETDRRAGHALSPAGPECEARS